MTSPLSANTDASCRVRGEGPGVGLPFRTPEPDFVRTSGRANPNQIQTMPKLRREQPPQATESISKTDLPLNDPDYHYRVVSKEDDTAHRVDYHKGLGYGVAHEGDRQITMGCLREEHEQRQQEAKQRADRLRSHQNAPSKEIVHDETTIEVTRGVHADE